VVGGGGRGGRGGGWGRAWGGGPRGGGVGQTLFSCVFLGVGGRGSGGGGGGGLAFFTPAGPQVAYRERSEWPGTWTYLVETCRTSGERNFLGRTDSLGGLFPGRNGYAEASM